MRDGVGGGNWNLACCPLRVTVATRPEVPFARVEQISARVWLIVEDDRFNEHPFLYVIVGRSRVVLVDTGVGTGGASAYYEWLRAWLPSVLGGSAAAAASRPLLVISTHCHFDHVGGNAGLARAGATLAASGRDPPFTRAALDPRRDSSLAAEVVGGSRHARARARRTRRGGASQIQL